MNSIDVKMIRRKLGLTQYEFWTRIGVSQSAGCRYELGRRVPKPVMELLRIVHIEGIDLAKVSGEDLAILDYLKSHEAHIYQKARQNVDSPSLTTFA